MKKFYSNKSTESQQTGEITTSETKSQPRIRKKWLLIALAAGSGLLSILSNSGVGVWPLAWVAWIPLLLALKEVNTWKSAFLLGYVNGLIQYLGTLYWIALLAPFAETGNIFTNWLTTGTGYLVMSGYLSIYPAVFCLVVLLTYQRQRSHSIDFIPRSLAIFQLAAVWTGLEWVSEWMMSGFPWISLGYTQWQNLPSIQIASIFGVHGVSFVLMLFNVLLATLFDSNWQVRVRATIPPFSVVCASLIFGWIVLTQPAKATHQVKIGLVPGNIPQSEKWNPQNFKSIFQRYLSLLEKACSTQLDIETENLKGESQPVSSQNLDFLTLPETAFSSPIFSGGANVYVHQLQQLLEEQETNLLTGVPHYVYESQEGKPKPVRKAYNTVFLLDSEGKKLGAYSKIHLVPFGEYTPFADVLPDLIQLPTGFSPGRGYETFPIPNWPELRMGVAICFESSFPDLVRQFVLEGADLLGILTNDAWFENTPAPLQHFAMTPFRAVENRVPVFRCANGGISCIIDQFGRQVTPTIWPNDKASVLVHQLPLIAGANPTLSTRWGNWFPILCFLLSVVLVAVQVKSRGIETSSARSVALL